MDQEKGIWIITEETASSDGGKSGIDTGANYDGGKPAIDTGANYGNEDNNGRKRSRLSADDLKQNMEEFLEVIEKALEQAEKPKSGMVLDDLSSM
ncbi:MAG: hypothetical protein QNJ33_13645 [Crocosphaera sp.]|nr:hypothetical protein [Crocosphaera sp.]